MTRREKEIIKILKENPLISQNDLAETLGISRSSAAVHITNLMKKGVILGKGYVIKDEKYVAVLGGANVDINGYPNDRFIPGDSNPGYVNRTLGGVGRNIAENLARLDMNTRLLTLVGNDEYGSWIIDNTKLAGVDVNFVKKTPHAETGIYITIQDENGDLIAAINQMDIYEKMDVSYVGEVANVFSSAQASVMDTNFSQEAIDYLFSKVNKGRIFVDPVSVAKSQRIKNHLNKVFLIKPNVREAEAISGLKIDGTKESYHAVGNYFMGKGTKNLILSLGSKGLYVRTTDYEGFVVHKDVKPVNVNGAGDALIATIVKQFCEGDHIKICAVKGVAAAINAILSEDTSSKDLNEETIEQMIKEYDIQWKNF